MRTEKKHQLQQLRRWRIRKKIVGSKDRPRMSVCFTNENIHVQFVDDEAGGKSAAKDLSANVNGAKAIGTMAAKNAMDKGIKEVVFDRGGKLYHGKVKALADAAREAGLKF
jgi:large subunit ribosomal protein L18